MATRLWIIEREVMQELLSTGGMCDPVWSPDGNKLAATSAKGLFVLDAPRYEPRQLFPSAAAGSSSTSSSTPSSSADQPAFRGPSWSPSGKRLAVLATINGKDVVQVVDAGSGASVFRSPPGAKAVAWGPDDKTLTIDGRRVTVP